MSEIRFGEIPHVAALALAFGTTVENLEHFAHASDQDAFYKAIRLPKKGKRRRGQFRTVYKAVQNLALLHKNIAMAVEANTEFDEHVHGFVSCRSTITNAAVHLGQRLLLHADIHHFFESIRRDQVEAAFVSLGCAPEVALTLTLICTRNGQLPEGSSASPIIANIVGRAVDTDLKALARSFGCRYTRYADDITMSGASVPDTSRVAAILERHGFTLRDGTCRMQRKGHSQYVTGLTIADTQRPRVPRVAKRRLRLELHYASRFGLDGHLDHVRSGRSWWQEMKRLGGWISYMSSVEGPDATARFSEQWRRILAQGPPDEPLDEPPDEPRTA